LLLISFPLIYAAEVLILAIIIAKQRFCSSGLRLTSTLHFLPTGYNPIRHAVSDYAVGRYGPLFRIGLWSSSIGMLTLAVGLALAVGFPQEMLETSYKKEGCS
jgi:hypothetical protein